MTNGKETILVTGATGNQGGAVARALLDRGHRVRAMTRKPEGPAARALASRGAEVVKGNMDDAGSLERAVLGAWGVFAVQNTWEAGVEHEEEQGKLLAEIARRQGVRHFVYSSVASAHRRTGIPHFDNKWRIEEKIRALDFPSHVILRPVFFMENWTSPWFRPALDQGKVMIGIKPETRLQQIAVEDIGKYGRLAFEKHEDLNRRDIDIAGDSKTMPETAEILGKTLGKKLEFVQVPIEEVRKSSADFALMLEWFDRVGYDADIAGNATRFDLPPTTLEQWASKVTWD
jgi:uncharacterized protein YbjT (DUF2867 family)